MQLLTVAIFYGLYYISLDRFAGILAFGLLFQGARLATLFGQSSEHAWNQATALHIAWFA